MYCLCFVLAFCVTADDSSCNLSHHELLAMYSRGEAPVVKKKKRCAINDAENAPPLYSDVVSLDTFRHAQPGPCYENVSSASTLTYTSPDKQTRCRLAGEDVLCIEKDSVVWGKEKESGTCIQGHKHNKFAVLECDGKKRFHLDGHILPPNVAVLVRSRSVVTAFFLHISPLFSEQIYRGQIWDSSICSGECQSLSVCC